jgi:hypothetical protein
MNSFLIPLMVKILYSLSKLDANDKEFYWKLFRSVTCVNLVRYGRSLAVHLVLIGYERHLEHILQCSR